MPTSDAFLNWLRERSAAAGHDLAVRGGFASLGRSTGIDSGLLSRIFGGQVEPGIPTQRALAGALGVSLREMLIRSGTMTADDLEAVPAEVSPLDVRQVGVGLGVRADRLDEFEEILYAVARTFAANDKKAGKKRPS